MALSIQRSFGAFGGRVTLALLAMCFIALLGSSSAYAQRPRVTSFSPLFGPPGTIVTITGDSLLGADEVLVGSTPGLILSRTQTQLRFMVLFNGTGNSRLFVRRTTPTLLSDSSITRYAVTRSQPPVALQSSPVLTDVAPVHNKAEQGEAVALSAEGRWAVVGGSRNALSTTPGQLGRSVGSVWIYERVGCSWMSRQRISPALSADLPRFGRAVAVSALGEVIVVGGPDASNRVGAFWIFRRSGSTWVEEARIVPPDVRPGTTNNAGSGVGSSIAISADGNTVVVGAPRDGESATNAQQGGFWIYRFDGINWNPLPLVGGGPSAFRHTPAGALANDRVGTSVAISATANLIAVGAPGTSGGDGAVYVYRLNSLTGLYEPNTSPAAFRAPGIPGLERAFGDAVALSARGNNLAIGAPIENLQEGRVYVFTRNDVGEWNSTPQTIVPNGALGGALFGNSIGLAADGNEIVVGGPNQNTFSSTNIGAAWIYARTGTQWSLIDLVQPSESQGSSGEGASIGTAVALSGDGGTALLGAPRNAQGQGAVWAYSEPAPTFSAVSPRQALTGQTVSITGANFRDVTSVSIGGMPAAFEVTSSTTIRATVPISATPGTTSITVAAACASGPVPTSFTVLLQPVVDSIVPNRAGRGALVRIYGRNLQLTTLVTLGGVPITGLQVINSTLVEGRVGGGATGALQVVTSNGTASVSNAFTFVQPPSLVSYFPFEAGPGQSITLTGTNFSAGETNVSFGGTTATSVSVSSPTHLTAVLGSGSTGLVIVSTPGGADTLAGFTRVIPVPTITRFSPNPYATGDTVRIVGTDLHYTPAVTFGGVPAASLTLVTPTELRAVVGPGAAGEVCVTTLGGSFCRVGGLYVPPPVVSGFSPTSGQYLDTVTVTGTQLSGATQVLFDGVPSPWVRNLSSTSVRAVVGQGRSGRVSVRTRGGLGQSGSDFSFASPAPSLLSVTPSSVAPLQRVEVSGTNLGSVQSVNVGPAGGPYIAASFSVLSGTRLSVVMPTTLSITSTELRIEALQPGTMSAPFILALPITPILAAPTISAVSSSDIGSGGFIFVTGSNLGNATSVDLGLPGSPTPATLIRISNDSLRVNMGSAVSGQLRVCNPNGCALSATSLTARPPMTIAPFSLNACAGGPLNINGTNFYGFDQLRVTLGGHPVRSVNLGPTTNVNNINVVVDTCCDGAIRIEGPTGVVQSAPNAFNYACNGTVTSFFPTAVRPGDWVVVNGTFQGVYAVVVGSATVPNDTANIQYLGAIPGSFRFRVPHGGSSGFFLIKTTLGDFFSSGPLTWIAPSPVITGLSPDSVRVGDIFKIIGRNFAGITNVSFAGINCPVYTVSPDSILISVQMPSVPNSLIRGNVSVSNAAATAFSSDSIRIRHRPQFSGFSPAFGTPFSTFELSADRVSDIQNITIGNAIPTRFTAINSTTLRVTIDKPNTRPVGPLNESLNVLTRNGLSVLGNPLFPLFNFTFPLPTISSVSPLVAKESNVIRVVGSGLFPPDLVRVAGVTCTEFRTSPTFDTLWVTVPQLSVDTSLVGPVTVQIVGAQASSAQSVTLLPPPVIETVEPAVASVASGLIVRGRNLAQVATVSVGGVNVTSAVTPGDDRQFSVALAANTPPGNQLLRLTNVAGDDTISILFAPPPVITSFTPRQALPGGTETISVIGTGLSWLKRAGCTECRFSVAGVNVSLAAIQALGDTELRFQVPLQASPSVGLVSLTTQGGSVSSDTTFQILGFQITSSEDLSSIITFPNPTADQITVRGRLSPSSASLELALFNLYGAEVLKQRSPNPANGTEQSTTLDLRSLPPGTYFLIATFGRATRRWIVTKL